ncbi:hypothetical protein H2O64_09240 [Kordia sp. YSTF-M3]|uniref:Lipocalin-like domain-containing protein n=1 Tax=Kordia aestuariivivens TaxID=2759037 RepID=A0ABR7Q8T3_9FLAO|nr:hypothetical protein [Kordia aestuariivivens]MBC8754853.1 hypothetical protein [Kordia aestuariivivens]
MKIIQNLLAVSILFAMLTFTSCRTEEVEIIEAPQEEVLVANSPAAILMKNIATNDGSADNIIDNSNCFNILLPVTVFVNGLEIIVDSEDDFNTIEAIFDEFEDDNDDLQIQFPIVIVAADYTQITINNLAEFTALSANCNGPNVSDDDIECLDFQYPIIASIFNANNELLDTITIQTDEQMYNFIDTINVNDIINIQFPITVTTFDGLTITVNDFNELVSTINDYADACDEDDDNDYNDDDCNDCTDNQLTNILTQCTDWTVDKLERNDIDLEDNFTGYTFNFTANGTINITSVGGNYTGTWAASGSGNNISVTVTVPDFTDLNNTWILHEIEQDGETKVDLRLGDDRLRFESDCTGTGGGNVDDTALTNALTMGDWYITYYFDDADETANYNGYVFNFASDGNATTTISGTATPGFWTTSAGDQTALELNLNFGTSVPLDELAEDWDVLEVTNDIIRLKDISGGNGSNDYLTFERNPSGGGPNNLSIVLGSGNWVVSSYTDDGVDETADYNGYQLNFDSNGTVIADNGTPINGTWTTQSSGSVLILDFGTSMPFDELNDDWDVVSITSTQVKVQDVSGGNGGTDILILDKL